MRSLAAAALRDPSSPALERLRSIDRVDRRRLRLADALKGTRGELRLRLRLLAGDAGEGAPGTAPATARSTARDVLSDGRYRSRSLPRPLHGVLAWLGDRLAPLWGWIAAGFEALAAGLPGGQVTLWAVLAGVILAATALLSIRAAARRQSTVTGAGPASRTGEPVGAARLLADAARAQARGDLDEALRLRFRAGLLELDRRELIELRPALTNRELLATVASPTLGGLVAGFESVAYGGRPAGEKGARALRRRRRGPHGARVHRRAAVSPTPRSAAALAAIALSVLLVGPLVAGLLAAALAGAVLADALAARRPPRGQRLMAAVVARGVPSALRVELLDEGAGADAPVGRRLRVRQACAPEVDVEAQEAHGGLTARLVAHRRGRRLLPAVVVRAEGPIGSATAAERSPSMRRSAVA